VLKRHNKRPAVYLVKRKRKRKYYNWRAQNDGEVYRQEGKKYKTHATSSSEIDKLLERKWPKYFILQLNKLRHLVLHRILVYLGYGGATKISCTPTLSARGTGLLYRRALVRCLAFLVWAVPPPFFLRASAQLRASLVQQQVLLLYAVLPKYGSLLGQP